MGWKNAFHRLYERQLRWQFKLYESIGEGQRTRLNRDKIVLQNLDNAAEEVFEARRHVNVRKYWNPKKRDKSMNDNERLMCAEEIIDVIHFLMTALIYLDVDYNQIESILNEKMDYNDKRSDHSNEK